jgi:uncharacterized repeat protein (TIGR03803 family)
VKNEFICVSVCSFTFRFGAKEEIAEYISFLEKKTHPTSPVPDEMLADCSILHWHHFFVLVLLGEKVPSSSGSKPSDSNYPLFGGLVFDKKGNLYGTTSEGGIFGEGTVFELTSKGREKILYNFGAQPNDGMFPEAGVVFDTSGNLYGTTPFGGVYGSGTVFKITP